MENGLNKTIIEKMKLEKKTNREIDSMVNEFRARNQVFDIIKVIERIRLYRERIFELKCQVKDINKLYDKLKIPNFFGEYRESLFPNVQEKQIANNCNNNVSYAKEYNLDASRFYFLIYNYYEQIIADLEQVLLEEKAEDYTFQKEFESNEEEVIELQ